jgi:hypothetical protein
MLVGLHQPAHHARVHESSVGQRHRQPGAQQMFEHLLAVEA